MTLQEAINAKHLRRLELGSGYIECGKLTGRYFYETLGEVEKESDIKVEIKTGWFSTKWVHLIHLKEVKEYR